MSAPLICAAKEPEPALASPSNIPRQAIRALLQYNLRLQILIARSETSCSVGPNLLIAENPRSWWLHS
jgi:hypothetical protein